MKFLEPNIVVIDDVKSEVQGILDYYRELGVGCKLFNASYFDGDTMPSNCFSDVNLIFLDLYYSERFDAEQCSNWVQSLVSEKSFYILVLWTKDTSKSNSVLEHLKQVNRMPFTFLVKSKTDYSKIGEEKYDYSKLFEEINTELDTIPALEEIQIWKKSVKHSTNEILGHLTKTSDPNIFNDKLKKIIICHGGGSIKSSSNNIRKRLILFDALDSILISNTRKNINENNITELNIENLYNLDKVEDSVIDKELNSWFHFKLEKNLTNELISPGIISEFKDNDWRNKYSIHDDKIVMDFISHQSGNNVKISSIALLLSRPCDIAQNKFGKNLKLLSGLKIVNPIRKENAKKEFKKGSSNVDSIKIYDHLYLSEEENDVTFLFDFRYTFSVPEESFKAEFNNIKIFNKELLSEMQVEYSSYSSRLGITQIF
ncbi:MAG: hypothetical protein HOO91_01795 [Bacteroidales bacterium]|nr:hypothetical protein [Bacteroidales bacterium]